VLLIIDEVVCGLGRTGTWFGYQQYGVQPDIVTMAKGVASGYAAISCTVTTEAVFNEFKSNPDDPMSHFRDISTFGGCTGGPAAAIANMAIIEDEKLLDNVQAMGEYMKEKLQSLSGRHAIIGEVRGKGLFLGVELVSNRDTKAALPEKLVQAIVGDCMTKSAVIIGATNRSITDLNNTLCLSPAYICKKSDVDEIVSAIDGAMTRTMAAH
jgi:taurine-pyruvate aminotransferase